MVEIFIRWFHTTVDLLAKGVQYEPQSGTFMKAKGYLAAPDRSTSIVSTIWPTNSLFDLGHFCGFSILMGNLYYLFAVRENEKEKRLDKVLKLCFMMIDFNKTRRGLIFK